MINRLTESIITRDCFKIDSHAKTNNMMSNIITLQFLNDVGKLHHFDLIRQYSYNYYHQNTYYKANKFY